MGQSYTQRKSARITSHADMRVRPVDSEGLYCNNKKASVAKR